MPCLDRDHLSNQGSFYEIFKSTLCIGTSLLLQRAAATKVCISYANDSNCSTCLIERVIVIPLSMCIHAWDFQIYYLYLLLISVNYKTLCNMIRNDWTFSVEYFANSISIMHMRTRFYCSCVSCIFFLFCFGLVLFCIWCAMIKSSKKWKSDGMQMVNESKEA